MKRWIWISLIVLVIAIVSFMVIRKEAAKKKERAAYGGHTREELKRKLELAWKDYYFQEFELWLRDSPDAKEWRDSIIADAELKDKDLDEAFLHAVQFSWAESKPKAWTTGQWSRGWLEQIYLKDIGVEATPEVKLLLREI